MEEAANFLAKLDKKAVKKILYHVDLAEQTNDPKLLKKLNGEIWEFRAQHMGNQYRLFAFWDKRTKTHTLVVATHGIVKKDQKTPKKEIAKAQKIREHYFKNS
ncbi:type II toxin-antitoxin system RelE/ParE family toxin [Sphingobacterium hungaricum]|uniref:type II toxin-antitoxin system RelE/ParE family toxin n=1 Tax=Sphingobacterium hungaricum TaxID=2082723 RepID=UPI001E471100|nr:type II toxin-antitoxin system RelE/ParE family toxin [Sphingobacterium hungaricum]